MKFYYREHRGSLKDALKTEKVFKSFVDIVSYLDHYVNFKDVVHISFYCFDDRENIGTTFIVTCKGFGVLGFIYLRDYKR